MMDKLEDGYILPEKPNEPLEADCCGSGCSYCVFDVYKEELRKWETECERLSRGGKPLNRPQALSQLEFKTFKLSGIYPSAKNLNIYRFAVLNSTINIKPGQHLMMKGLVKKEWVVESIEENEVIGQIDEAMKSKEENLHSLEERKTFKAAFLEDEYITRPYTVLNNKEDYFEVLIKVYSNGKLSQYIKRLTVGDEVLWRGPFGNFSHCPSYVQSNSVEGYNTILALCAGTGIAPVYAIAKSIIEDEDDETRIRLLWANCCWNELPLVQEMKELSSYWNFSCKLFFSEGVENVPASVKSYYEVYDGKINEEILKIELDSLVAQIQIMLCGSTSFEEDMLAFLSDLGLKYSACHRFL